MRLIKRGREPKGLSTYKRTPGACFEGWTDREDVKKQLLKEQGYLCAYCTKRIHYTDMKIEHIIAQSAKIEGREIGKEQSLNYSNFLAVCMGGPGNKKQKNQSCDTARGNENLKVNPLEKNTLDQIYYKRNGEIHSSDDSGDDCIELDLTKTLNLNCNKAPHFFLRNRLEVMEGVKQRLNKTGNWNASELKKVKRILMEKNNKGEMQPFADYAIYKIEKRLNR